MQPWMRRVAVPLPRRCTPVRVTLPLAIPTPCGETVDRAGSMAGAVGADFCASSTSRSLIQKSSPRPAGQPTNCRQGWIAPIRAGHYAMVSLLIGVNNQFRGRSIDEFHGQFAGLLKRCDRIGGRQQFAHVIVLSIPDWGVTPFAQRPGSCASSASRSTSSIPFAGTNAPKRNVAFVDITPISKHAAEDPSLVADDGLHPSGKMYAQWCQAALPAAKAALGK